MADKFPNPGEVFQARYEIISELNRGGFGRVYRAQQIELKRDVAIKVLQPVKREGIDEDQQEQRLEIVAKRFEREAQLVSQLRDSHTVMMHDYGTTEEGLLFMVLEFIDGRDLTQLIGDEGAMTPDRVVKVARQVLSSLEEAHHLNMLHRDVKPGNIMVFDHAGRSDQVKVLDFGLAKSVESGDFRAENPDLTGEEVILGTPRYMSPEQIRGEQLGPTTDIYSLGLVMYEMLTGQKAVEGDSTMTTLARHLNDVPIQLPHDVDVPERLRHIVDTMLQKDPEERVPTARAAMELLGDWDAAGPIPNEGDIGEDSDVAIAYFSPDKERQKQMLIWGASALMSVFLIVGVVYAIIGNSTEASEAAEVAEAEDESGQREDETALAAGIDAPPPSDDEKSEEKPAAPDEPVEEQVVEEQALDPAPTEGSEETPPEGDAVDPTLAAQQDEPAAGEQEGFEFGVAGEEPAGEESAEEETKPAEPATEPEPKTEKESTKRKRSGKKKRSTTKKSTGLKIRTLK